MAMLKYRWLITIMCLFIFDGHIDVLEANGRCPEGQKKNARTGICEECPPDQYQPKNIDSTTCQVCTQCNKDKFSVVEQNCSKISDTKCRCLQRFVPRDKNSAICKCDVGYGLKTIGGEKQCNECEHGFFTAKINSECVKWNECKRSGVKINGTKSTDAICNKDLDESSNIMASPTMPVTSHLADTKTLTQVPQLTTTKYIPRLVVPTENREVLFPLEADNKIGIISIMVVGIVGLLVLAAVTCKLNIIPCIKDNDLKKEQKKGSVCRRPVEESGDSSRSSLVKPTPVEP